MINELKIWQLKTDLDKKKKTLSGKAKEVARNCKVEDWKQENGIDTLINTFDNLVLKESTESAYKAYKNINDIQRDNVHIKLLNLIKVSIKMLNIK